MLKKRLFLLVILQVALTLVSSDNDGDLQIAQAYEGEIADGVYQGEEAQVDGFEGGDMVDSVLPDQLADDEPVDEEPTDDEPVDDEDQENNPEVEEEQSPVEEKQPEDNAEATNTDDGEGTYTVRKTKKTRRKKKTTPSPPLNCYELEEIKAAQDDCINNVPKTYSLGECYFQIVNEETCQWECPCGTTLTEAPLEAPPPPPQEEEDEPDSAEDEIDECEPKKKFKFDNCFLKIRGLIKKKKPTRC